MLGLWLPLISEISTSDTSYSVETLQFSFVYALLSLSLLLIIGIIFDKVGLKLGIPGSIFLFFSGLFFHNVTGFNLETFPLEEIHVVSVTILLFFSGLAFSKSLLKRSKILISSLLLAVFGTLFSMIIGLILLRLGFGFLQVYFNLLPNVEPQKLWLIATAIVFSLAVQDWNSFTFVSNKIADFREVISDIFKIETSVSAAISLIFAELLVLAWMHIYANDSILIQESIFISIIKGVLIGILSGFILGYLLMFVIRNIVTSRPQLVLIAISFSFIGYVVSFYLAGSGGYLSALVMGIFTSISYRSSASSEEVEFLTEELESLNIASEAILFFAIGLGMEATSFFHHLPIAILVWLGVILVRPASVFMFFRGDSIEPEEFKILSSWSPKGAISMALIVTAPALLEETFGLEGVELIQKSSVIFMVDIVCGVVIFSMIIKSLIIPMIHDKLTISSKSLF